MNTKFLFLNFVVNDFDEYKILILHFNIIPTK